MRCFDPWRFVRCALVGLAVCVALAVPAAVVTGNTIDTFAGGGPAPSALATAVGIQPYDIAIDPAGNLLVAEGPQARVLRVDGAAGTVATVAGNGTAGSCGDGSPPTGACLTNAAGIAIDPAGNVFIADGADIRRVDAGSRPPSDAGGLRRELRR